jgi:hypothetical protein
MPLKTLKEKLTAKDFESVKALLDEHGKEKEPGSVQKRIDELARAHKLKPLTEAQGDYGLDEHGHFTCLEP